MQVVRSNTPLVQTEQRLLVRVQGYLPPNFTVGLFLAKSAKFLGFLIVRVFSIAASQPSIKL